MLKKRICVKETPEKGKGVYAIVLENGTQSFVKKFQVGSEKKNSLMKVFLVLFSLWLGVVTGLRSQSTFERCIGWIDDEYATQAILTSDSCVAISGYTHNFMNLVYDGFVLKTNLQGDTLWTRRFGDTNLVDVPRSLTETPYRELVLAGYQGEVPFTMLGKWKMNGEFVWWKRIFNFYSPAAVISTADSCTAFCGAYGNVLIAKTDTSGNFRWNKTFNTVETTNVFGMIQATSGSYILCGVQSHPDGPGLASWVALAKADGTPFWQKIHGEWEHMQIAYGIRQTRDGGYIYCGVHSGSYMWPTTWDPLFVKTKENGNVSWTRILDMDGDNELFSCDTTSDGGFIFCGKTDGSGAGGFDVLLIRANMQGDTLWTRTFGGPYDDVAKSVVTMPDGGFLVCGYSNSFETNGYDIYLIRTDSLGRVASGVGNLSDKYRKTRYSSGKSVQP